jgi:uncharacterized protein (TIGR00251 family)
MPSGLEPAIGSDDKGLVLAVSVTPRAKRDLLAGWRADGRLKISLTAPPVEGKANADLIRFLARTLGLKKNQVQIVAGQTSRHKTIRLAGLSRDELVSRLPPVDG